MAKKQNTKAAKAATNTADSPAVPTVGRIVNYVLGSGPRQSEIRPAIVTRIVNDKAVVVALQVFVDNENDGFNGNTLWRPEVTHDADKAGNTWHWPVREAAAEAEAEAPASEEKMEAPAAAPAAI